MTLQESIALAAHREMSHAWEDTVRSHSPHGKGHQFLLLSFGPVATMNDPLDKNKILCTIYKSPHGPCFTLHHSPPHSLLLLWGNSAVLLKSLLLSSFLFLTHWNNPPSLSLPAPPPLACLASPCPARLGLQMLLPSGRRPGIWTISNPVSPTLLLHGPRTSPIISVSSLREGLPTSSSLFHH